MPYCTEQDLVERFSERELVQLTDDTGQGIIDATKTARAISDASAEIDGYLGGRYTLPLAAVPVVLTRLACDLARYHLHDDLVPDTVQKRYDNALRFLRDVSTGKASLGLDEAGADAKPADAASISSAGKVFGRDDTSFI